MLLAVAQAAVVHGVVVKYRHHVRVVRCMKPSVPAVAAQPPYLSFLVKTAPCIVVIVSRHNELLVVLAVMIRAGIAVAAIIIMVVVTATVVAMVVVAVTVIVVVVTAVTAVTLAGKIPYEQGARKGILSFASVHML